MKREWMNLFLQLFSGSVLSSSPVSQAVEIVSNIHPNFFGLNLRTHRFFELILVRRFAPFTTCAVSSMGE
jgi:hypothetical protein